MLWLKPITLKPLLVTFFAVFPKKTFNFKNIKDYWKFLVIFLKILKSSNVLQQLKAIASCVLRNSTNVFTAIINLQDMTKTRQKIKINFNGNRQID